MLVFMNNLEILNTSLTVNIDHTNEKNVEKLIQ